MAQLQDPQSMSLSALGLLQGPGTATSDSIPAALSDGEVIIPADDVRRFGAAQIMAMVKKGGGGMPKPKVKQGLVHAAVGGLITDPAEQAQVRRVDNITMPQPLGGRPAGAPVAPGAVTRVGNSYSGGNVSGPISINGGAPGGTVNTANWMSPAAQPLTAGLGQPPAAQPAAQQPLTAAAAQVPRAAPAAQPAPVSMDRNADFYAGADARNAQARQGYPVRPRLGFARGGLVSQDDLPLATQAQVRRVDANPANAAAIAGPSLTQLAKSGAQPAPGAAVPAEDPIVAINRSARQARSLSALALDQARQGVGVPGTPGLGVIDGAASDARQKFFDEANLRNAANRTTWSPRRGYQTDEAAVQAAAMPLVQRAEAERVAAQQAGANQRAQLAEQSLAVRAQMEDQRQAEATGIQRERLQFEAAREDRAQTQALTEQERKARIAQIDEQIVSGTPEQRKAAAAQKAALMGRGMDEVGKVGEVSTAIRKEFEGLPEVKNYKQALPAYRGIEDAVKRNTPMSDINLVYGIAKMYDPNSVVREGEYATVANASAIPERVKGLVNFVQGGGKLTPEVKSQIMNEATSRMQTFDKEYGAVLGRYGDIARRSGADATLVVPQDYQPLAGPQPQGEPAQMAELRRRAANNPQLAQRLQQMGY